MSTNLMDNLYVAWAIAAKDIVEALKNKATRTNIIMMLGMVAFLSTYSNIRPWDKRIDVVVYNEGSTNLMFDTTEVSDGYTFAFYEASSIPEMERMMTLRGMGLSMGLVLPVDLDQALEAGGELTVTGYLLWVNRGKVAELETLYSEKLTELLGQTVRIELKGNIVLPPPDAQSTSTNFTLLFAIFFMAFMVVPALMLEEKRTKTLDALLVSPASAAQVVMGKALAGLFYVGLVGGLSFTFNWAYVTDWGLALLAFLCTTVFAIGLGLALGSFIPSSQQLMLWGILLNIFLLTPALFALEPLLAEGLRTVLSWLPTVALVKLFQFSFSAGVTATQLWTNLAIALGYTAVIFTLVVWKIRRSDR